ncbi:aquaporin [Nocardia stercoris]|uniref:Aquaporin Z n=1 Tax=Nocardia stercoris TaxID=2483361 RepID=A0A3M2L5I7_9NOCA|nr:aquaporin [Nocardia stercoris]RMI32919.1 aquaporin Z [Nocardia stercoris]
MSDSQTDAPTKFPSTAARLGAETLGTFWLVLGGCGAVVFFGGAERVAVSLAFGLTVLTGAYALGHISGAHFNPAVTVGLATARRFGWQNVPGYVAAQVVGATLGGLAILIIAKGQSGFVAKGHMATNGWGGDNYSLWAVIIAEILLTAMFLYVILGVTSPRATPATAGVTIGLALTLIHLVSIPIDGTSVNPARSLGVAWFGGGHALAQVWVFLVAPLVGAILAGVTHKLITGED